MYWYVLLGRSVQSLACTVAASSLAAHPVCCPCSQVCDDEEIEPIAEVRSRIHHNLGKLYMKQLDIERAKQHFTADIAICSRLLLLEEEAKGWISLGDLQFKHEDYEEALSVSLFAGAMAVSALVLPS